jgi:pimeloyl-ACP methyl ester carboxylesterase
MQFLRNVIAAAVVLWAPDAAPASAQPQTTDFLVFAGGRQIGREQVTIGTSGTDRIISSTGRHSPPVDITITQFQARYSGDWQPIELSIDATIGGRVIGLKTSFGLTTAVNEITQGGKTNSKTDQVSARTVILPNGFFAAYEALAARLAASQPGTEIPIYVAPQEEVKAFVKSVRDEQLQYPGGAVAAKVYEVALQSAGAAQPTTITVDAAGRLARIDVSGGTLSVVRADLASVAVRRHTTRNSTDSDVSIPANGFTVAGTVTTPTQAAGRLRHPAVILVPGARATDRDETLAGVPLYQQLAAQLADKGFLVLRYDRRGFGQSGGRVESATLEDSADDVLATYRWVKKRRDVDDSRVTVLGHSEGGLVAMIAAAKEEDISHLVLLATPGIRGAEFVLEQQRQELAQMNASDEERAAKIAFQERLHLAVISGVGWENMPANVRKQADTPWFRSLLLFDPSTVVTRVKQPMLIVQGALDTRVPVHHGERLAELGRKRKKSPPVQLSTLSGTNHQFVNDQKQKAVAAEVATAISDFLRK